MKSGRRYFLANFIVTLAGTKTLWAGGQRQVPWTQNPQFPDASGSKRQREDVPLPPISDPKVQLTESQKNLRRAADHLFELAKELKDQVDETEQTKVLSLPLLHKAEEVEKLARQIKDLVRAA